MMNTKLIHLQDHSGICAPPQHGLGGAIPGENAFAVSFPKSLSAQVLAGCEQARSTATLTPRTRRVGQWLVRLYPSKGRLGGTLQSGSKSLLGCSQLNAVKSFDFNFRQNRVPLHCIHTSSALKQLNPFGQLNSLKKSIQVSRVFPLKRGLV